MSSGIFPQKALTAPPHHGVIGQGGKMLCFNSRSKSAVEFMSSTVETSLGNPLIKERLGHKHNNLRLHPILAHLSYDVGAQALLPCLSSPPEGCWVMRCAYANATHNGRQYQVRNPQASNSGQFQKFPSVAKRLYKAPPPPRKKTAPIQNPTGTKLRISRDACEELHLPYEIDAKQAH